MSYKYTMPKLAGDNPSKATMQRRSQRLAKISNGDPVAIKAKAAAYARELRAKKKEACQTQIEAAGIQGCKIKLFDDMSTIIKETLTSDESKPKYVMSDIVRTKVVDLAQQSQIKISKHHTVDDLGKILYDHSTEEHKDEPKKAINLKTSKEYVVRLLHYQSMIIGKKEGTLNLENFRDIDKAIDILDKAKSAGGKTKGQPLSLSSKIVYIGALSAVLRRISGFEKEYKIVVEKYKKWHGTYEDVRKDNQMTTAERENFVDWPTLQKLVLAELKKKKGDFSEHDRLLMAMYVLIPPRRVEDYSAMYVTQNADIDDSSKNWAVFDGTGALIKFVINVYKTSKRYGKYVRMEFPPQLKTVAKNVFKNKKEGDPLFATIKNVMNKPNSFSTKISAVFLKLTGSKAGVLTLRHSAITNFLSKPLLTTRNKEDMAKAMGHSVAMQGLYNRVDSIDDKEVKDDL